jgi:hypothetical protein
VLLEQARATRQSGVQRRFLSRLDGEDIVRLAAIWERLGTGEVPNGERDGKPGS